MEAMKIYIKLLKSSMQDMGDILDKENSTGDGEW